MASQKRPRENASAPETPIASTLPADLMLEIVARSELCALVRCAAASKLLRRDILSPDFIRRVSRQAAPCILAHLCTFAPEIPTLVHPATSDAVSLWDDHLFPFLLRRAADLFDKYFVVASRHGVVLLRRYIMKDRPESESCFDLCVYDPMSGARTFLPQPPEIHNSGEYVLLTAADGIDCSFLLLVAPQYGRSIKVQTASSCGTWGPVTDVSGCIKNHCNPAVLHGGVIHWLDYRHEQILSYDVDTGRPDSVKLPSTCDDVDKLHLATSSDGKLLKLLAIERFMMSVWLQLPVSAAGGSDWSLEVVIDMEEKLRSVLPDIAGDFDEPLEFKGSGLRSGIVFLEVCRLGPRDAFIAFNLETKEVHMQKRGFSLLEIDLASRLQSMKIFS